MSDYGGRGPSGGESTLPHSATPQSPPSPSPQAPVESQSAQGGSTVGVDLSSMAGSSGGGGGTLVAPSMSPLPQAGGPVGGGGHYMGGSSVPNQDYLPSEAYYGQPPHPEEAGETDDGVGQGPLPNASTAASSDDGLAHEGRESGGPVKLFVGQVPKSMTEEDLFPTFADFGPIKELMIIRDKHTGQHRGCAFVTYWAVEDAQNVQQTLHDQMMLPGGRKPLQIRPAIESGHRSSPSTVEQENKLFVGMTSRNADENSIRELFAPFGEIREIYIIRHADGSNKGCAFLKFVQRESALSAIEALNDKIVMEGATRPLIVKFADTKAQRRARQGGGSGRGRGHGDNPNGGNPYYMSHSGPPVPVYPNYPQQGQQGPPMAMPPQYSQQYSHGPYPGVSPGGTPPPPHNYMYPVPRHPHASHPYGYPPTGPFPPHGGASGPPGSSDSEPYDAPGGQPPGGMPPMASRAPNRVGGPEGGYASVNPRPREGPTGANLFIYHLPHDLTDADLATAFNPFGNVISAKVYVDKYTGESKGFGFVSYDSVDAAEAAIEQMNGFQIGSKRLKVQHKRVSSNSGRRQDHYDAGGMPPPEGLTISTLPPSHPDAGIMGMMPQGAPPRQYPPEHQLSDSEEYRKEETG